MEPETEPQTHDCEIGTEGAQLPDKEYINGIFVAMYNLSLEKLLSVSTNKRRNNISNCQQELAI